MAPADVLERERAKAHRHDKRTDPLRYRSDPSFGEEHVAIVPEGPRPTWRRGAILVFGIVVACAVLAGAFAVAGRVSIPTPAPSACETSSSELVRSASTQQPARARQLIAEGLDPNAEDANGLSAWECAFARNDTPMVAAMVQGGADVEGLGRDRLELAATRALRGHDTASLRTFIDEDRADAALREALLFLAVDANDRDMMIVLRDAGIDLTTGLGHAVAFKESRSVTTLLELGVDANARTPGPAGGYSAVVAATLHRDYDLIDELLDAGADPTDTGVVDATTYKVAVRELTSQRAGRAYLPDVFDAELPAPVTPLAIAAFAGDLAIVRRLLEAGADPNQLSIHRFTALHAAIYGGDVDVVRTLLDHGADASPQPPFGIEPVDELASRLRREDIVVIINATRPAR